MELQEYIKELKQTNIINILGAVLEELCHEMGEEKVIKLVGSLTEYAIDKIDPPGGVVIDKISKSIAKKVAIPKLEKLTKEIIQKARDRHTLV